MKLLQLCFRLSSIIGLMGVLAVSANAGNWSADFDSPLPDSWTTAHATEPAGGTSGSFTAVVESGYLRLSETRNATDGGAFSGFGGTTDDVFTDVVVSAVVNAAMDSDDDLGVVARADDAGNGYFGNVDYELGSACIAKVRDFNRAEDMICSAVDSLSKSSSHYIQLSAMGSGTVDLQLDVYDGVGGMLLQTLSASDDGSVDGNPAYEGGIAGVYIVPKGTTIGDASGSIINGTWDNVSAAVPEPASVSLLLAAFVGLLAGRRRVR